MILILGIPYLMIRYGVSKVVRRRITHKQDDEILRLKRTRLTHVLHALRTL